MYWPHAPAKLRRHSACQPVTLPLTDEAAILCGAIITHPCLTRTGAANQFETTYEAFDGVEDVIETVRVHQVLVDRRGVAAEV